MFPAHVIEKLGLCAPSIAPWTISLADLPRGLVPSQRILLIGVAQKVYVQVFSGFSLKNTGLGRHDSCLFRGIII